jgi:nucleoside-diphosphate-sugar epimerase
MSEMILSAKIIESLQLLKGQKIFLTGGTGFFGKSFLDVILRFNQHCDFDILILTRNPDLFQKQTPEFNQLKQVRYHQGDVTDFSFPNENFDCIMHFATPADAKMNIERPLEMTRIIVEGMKRVLDFSAQCNAKDFLFTSSGAVYGKQPAEITHLPEDFIGAPDPTAPDSAYGIAKKYSETIGCAFADEMNFNFKIARCFAFTGKYLNQNGSFAIANFIKDAQNAADIQIKGDGTPYRSYLYSDDLIVWLLHILKSGGHKKIYNVGSDESINIKDLAHKVQQVLNPQINIQIHQKTQINTPVTRYVPNISKARTELNVEVWTKLETAILKSSK